VSIRVIRVPKKNLQTVEPETNTLSSLQDVRDGDQSRRACIVHQPFYALLKQDLEMRNKDVIVNVLIVHLFSE